MLNKILYPVGNLSGIALFTLLCLSAFKHYQKTHSLLSFSLVVVNALIITLYFVRREPKQLIAFPLAWFISIFATLLPFLFRPCEESPDLQWIGLGYYLQGFGLLGMAASLLSLGKSLGVVPANRGIKMGGLYQWIRHPLYASELLFFSGYALSNQSDANFLLLILLSTVQYMRSRIEENFLSNDSAYKLYMQRTRYRFIPGLL